MLRLQCFSIKLKSIVLNNTRGMAKRITRRIPTQVEEKLKLKDNVQMACELIYRAPMENYLLWTKNVAFASTVIVLLVGGYQWTKRDITITPPVQEMIFGMVTRQDDVWFFLGGFALINIFISMFISRYPLRIYKHADRYIAVYESHLPFRALKHEFPRGDVAELTHRLNPWSNISYRLGKRSSLLLTDYFRTPLDFLQMRGLN